MNKDEELKQLSCILKNFQNRFVRFANTYVRDIAVAEDFTIEAIMTYWENRHTLEQDSNIPAYILTIIKNKCLNYLQHLQVREAMVEKINAHFVWELQTRISTLEACTPNDLFTVEVQQIVDQTLAIMPVQTRRIFMLSRYHNMSHKEIALQLNITTKGVEFHISKALKLLRQSLKDYLPCFIYLFL